MIPEALRLQWVRATELKERVMHRLMPARMNVVPYSFPLMSESCPCDLHFCDLLRDRDVRGKSIFHFGTGGHHLVGSRNRSDALNNEILGITASPSEHRRYVRRVVGEPSFGRQYKVVFADIYDLSAQLLPEFDYVTLFHLCEYAPRGAINRETKMDDAGVLDLFWSKLVPEGRMVFYAGSYGHLETTLLVERAMAAGRIVFEGQYKSLLVYRRPLPVVRD